MEKILVFDFGGQYNQLIARRVRDLHVYAEIEPFDAITPEEIKARDYKGIIFTGGPNSVFDMSSPHYDPVVLELLSQRKEFGMTPEEMEALLDPKLYVGRCPQQVEAFLKTVEPLIAGVKRETAEINL